MLGASTALSSRQPTDVGNGVEDFNELVGLLRRQTGPFDIEHTKEMEAIRRRTPIRFPQAAPAFVCLWRPGMNCWAS